MFTAIIGLTSAQTLPPLKGEVERVKVHGAALEGNLEGDSADRDVSIYLPPSYRTSLGRRYAVVYILHGFTDSDDKWFALASHFVNAPVAMEAALEKGTAREMILVMPNADTRYAGSFYGSSAATGDWETFVTRELVAYIDGHFRTLASRASRGLAGHSMGGYGTIRLAMKYPDVYAGAYAMSACCMNEDTPSAEDLQKAEAVQSADDFNKADFVTKAVLALGAAWSANPTAPRFFDLPMKGGILQPLVMAQWNANSPVAMLGQYAANLKKVRSLALDIGLQDRLLPGNQLFHRLLTDHSVPHSFETYEGTHVNKIRERLETKVLPFFTKNLAFEQVPSSRGQ
jgi:S-formylglutathione hydrolase FrmB